MAHGDLDLTNIIVKEEVGGIVLKLVDYDNVWVPAFARLIPRPELLERGHEHFQHPSFWDKKKRSFDEYIDHFSALTIYTSLKALATYPNLHTDHNWGVGASYLLLTKEDYVAEKEFSTNHITMLHSLSIRGMEPLLQELSACIREERYPRSLSELVTDVDKQPSFTPLPDEPFVQKPSIVVDPEFEIVIPIWKSIHYIKPPDEPLVAPPQPDWKTTQPAGPQLPQHAAWGQAMEPTEPVQQQVWQLDPSPAKKSIAPTVIGLIVLLILVAIVVVVILFAKGILFVHPSGSPVWVVSPMMRTISLLNWLATAR